MSISTPPMQTNPAVTRAYTLTVYHVNLLSHLSEQTGKNQSEIVREALEDYARKHELMAQNHRDVK